MNRVVYSGVMAEQFEGRLEAGRGGGAYVELPADVLTALGGGSRFRVTGTLTGVDFASSAMAMGGGRVIVGMHKATREKAKVVIGELVEVRIERDDRPRELYKAEGGWLKGSGRTIIRSLVRFPFFL